jgi:nucleoside-diphosphate-sugar epimerase
VIHLAAEIASQRDADRVELVNVKGTQYLIEACARAGGPRFVLASTVVTGDAHGDVLDERSELPVETAYGRSKQAAEKLVAESGLPYAIVRPSHVYGPGGWFVEEFVTRLRQPGRFAVVGKGDNWWDVVHVDDVAAAFVLAAEDDRPGGTYHVVDDEPVKYYDFVALAASALGVGKPRSVPVWLASRVGGRDPVRAVVRSAKSSNALIKDSLGWEPRWATAREGVPDAVARLPGP